MTYTSRYLELKAKRDALAGLKRKPRLTNHQWNRLPTKSDKKLCTACRQEKPLNEFNKCGRSRDGHKSYCRACHSIKNSKRERGANNVSSKTI